MKTKNKIMCEDGKERTKKEYEDWISHLTKLYQMEPLDLTEAERQALIHEDIIDE